MKRSRAARAVSALGAVLLLAAPAPGEEVDRIAAVVDDEVILLSEVEDSAQPVLMRVAERNDGRVPSHLARQIWSSAVQALIDEKLLMWVARQNNLNTTPEEIDEAVARKAEEEGLSVEQLYAAAGEHGLGRETYRGLLAEEIVKLRVVSTIVLSRITVSDAEIRQLYQERYGRRDGMHARVRHILIPWPPPDSEATREEALTLASEVRTRALDGESFAVLARQYSRAPSAQEGGLDLFRQGELVEALNGPVFSLPVGEISAVIETLHGTNLVVVLERFDPGDISLDSVRERLRNELGERKTKPELEKLLQELRREHYVAIIAPELH